MKYYRIQNDTNVYFSTCVIVEWQCIFKEEKYFRDNKGLNVIGYVIMLNHLHLITYNSEGTTLSDIMRDFKHFKYTCLHPKFNLGRRICFTNKQGNMSFNYFACEYQKIYIFDLLVQAIKEICL